jgi:ABC-2 type transport system ATP-binding protein
VEVPKASALNKVFIALEAKGLRVLSMRNKTNRLEELFVRMVDEGKRP